MGQIHSGCCLNITSYIPIVHNGPVRKLIAFSAISGWWLWVSEGLMCVQGCTQFRSRTETWTQGCWTPNLSCCLSEGRVETDPLPPSFFPRWVKRQPHTKTTQVLRLRGISLKREVYLHKENERSPTRHNNMDESHKCNFEQNSNNLWLYLNKRNAWSSGKTNVCF